MSALLRLDGVEAGYGDLTAISGVSLEVREGEAVALIGSNGAGKTTTLRTISGLLPVRAGSDRVRGRAARRAPLGRDRRARHRPRAGGPPALSLADRARQPRARRARVGARDAERHAGAASSRSSRGCGSVRASWPGPVGRRAADVRDRPRAHGSAPAPPARRAEPRAGAGDGEAHLRDAPACQRHRHDDHARRAERPARARSSRIEATCSRTGAWCSTAHGRASWRART